MPTASTATPAFAASASILRDGPEAARLTARKEAAKAAFKNAGTFMAARVANVQYIIAAYRLEQFHALRTWGFDPVADQRRATAARSLRWERMVARRGRRDLARMAAAQASQVAA